MRRILCAAVFYKTKTRHNQQPVGREEAKEIAFAAGQITKEQYEKKQVFTSEELY